MIHHGDCVEVMAGMEPESVDAIVTDPPYGLEFMGKSWDRLGDVGTTSHAGPAAVAAGERGQYGKVANFGSGNLKCRKCGKWQWDHVGRKCECAQPDFPNRNRHQGLLMQAWHEAWALEALRVAKPGAYLLAFGGTRTVHRLACAIEDAGWIIRDTLVWAYAQGFPKSKASLKPSWEPIVWARKPFNVAVESVSEIHHALAALIWLTEGTPDGHGCSSERVARLFAESDPTATSRSRAVASTSSSIASSWASILADASGDTSRFTTSTGSRLTTALRTLSSCLSPVTSAITMPPCECLRDGSSSPVNGAASASSGEHTSTLDTLKRSVPETAIGPIAQSVASVCAAIAADLSADRAVEPIALDPATTRPGADSRPIVMARKPGPLRELAIDACRIGTDGGTAGADAGPSTGILGDGLNGRFGQPVDGLGRWPANVILTDPIFDGGIEGVVGGGEASAGSGWAGAAPSTTELFTGVGGTAVANYGDAGTYSRFFMLPRDGRSDAPSGRMGTCRTCGAPIAEPTSTARTPRPDTAPQNAVTRPLAPGDQLAFDAASPSPSPETATARSHAVTPPDGMPVSTVSEADPATASDTSGTTRSTSLEPTPDTAFRSNQPARSAEQPPISTGTTTTTADRSMCERCADDAIHGRTLPQRKLTRPALPVDGDDYTRFLILPKADRADREPVLGGLEPQARQGKYGSVQDGRPHTADGYVYGRPERANTHPTVKPTELMRHLVRLVTPFGGTVLDPFAGSGSTLLAAEGEGFAWIGIEKEAEYVAIAEARLNGTQRGLGLSA